MSFGKLDFLSDIVVVLGVLLEILFTRHLEGFFVLNRDVLLLVLLEGHISQFVLVILLIKCEPVPLAPFLDLCDSGLVSLVGLELPVVGQPGFETDVEIHDSEEWIHRLLLPCQQRNNDLFRGLDASDVKDSFLDFVLSINFLHLQLFVEREVSEVSFHGSVKKFIKVNVAIFRFNSHFKHFSFKV